MNERSGENGKKSHGALSPVQRGKEAFLQGASVLGGVSE